VEGIVTRFFLDTSAVIKRYRSETGSSWVRALTAPTAAHKIILSEITLAEFAAVIAAKHRARKGISRHERDRILALFLNHCHVDYELIPATRVLINRAVRLTQNHKLRGCDSIQLASALEANDILLAAGAPPLTFVAADKDLLVAARAVGLATENPDLYP
jgi:predicted nucleic acid-binding protein